MDRLLWLSLLFTHLPGTEGLTRKEECLSQPNRVIWKKTGQAAVLQCTVGSHCSSEGLLYEWFVFKENIHLRLDLSGDKYSLDGASLHIKSLSVNDSGIYLCATASHRSSECCSQYVGVGETLVVRDKIKIMVRHILLWVSFVLLAIYSMAVLTFILLKKHGCNRSVCRKTPKTNKNSASKKTQFRDVLQEMYRNRNQEKSKQIASGKHSQCEAEHNEVDSDGIYQNI